MSAEDVIATLRPLAEPERITRANVNQLLDTHRLQIHMTNGNWWDCRRNGQTRYWKRDANRIHIPFKYGFKSYGNITEADFGIPSGPDSFPQSEQDGTGRLNSLYFRAKPSITE